MAPSAISCAYHGMQQAPLGMPVPVLLSRDKLMATSERGGQAFVRTTSHSKTSVATSFAAPDREQFG